MPSQPPLPWRGRITSSLAPGRPGQPGRHRRGRGRGRGASSAPPRPRTSSPSRDRRQPTSARPNGRYRRFILHYAHLCAAAGGVDAFCIGSEMRALTQIRGRRGLPGGRGSARAGGRRARDSGPDAKIGYAADWTEYFGYHPQDGSGDVFFHLDPLWADRAHRFRRHRQLHAALRLARRTGARRRRTGGSIYDLDYLRANIAGGEGYDWYYPIAEARGGADPHADHRRRLRRALGVPLQGHPSWWSNPHHDRIGGERQAEADALGAALEAHLVHRVRLRGDRQGHQPAEQVPRSRSRRNRRCRNTRAGGRDDLIQMQYLRAMHGYWRATGEQPGLARLRRPDGRHEPRPCLGLGRAALSLLSRQSRTLERRRQLSPAATGSPGRVSSRALADVVAEICAALGCHLAGR